MIKKEKYDSMLRKLLKQSEFQLPLEHDKDICEKIIEGFEHLLSLNMDLGEDSLECIHISGRIINNKLSIRYLYTRSALETYLGKNDLKYETQYKCEDLWFDVNGIKLNRRDLFHGQKEKKKYTD